MKLTRISSTNTSVIREALEKRGLPSRHIEAAVGGLRHVTVLCDDLSPDDVFKIHEAAVSAGIDSLTGDDWALLSGGASRMGSLARPGNGGLPGEIAAQLAPAAASGLDSRQLWSMARGGVDLANPVVVGIVNVTPDSFSDGGRFLEPRDALRHAQRLVEEGAAMLDIGAESTRPGRPEPVPEAEEWKRLEPVVRGVRQELPGIPYSIDTVKSGVAARALGEGAWAINDVSGLRLDSRMAGVCGESGAGLVLMHSRGTVEEMASYDHARYDDLLREVTGEFECAVNRALEAGVGRESIVLDPGLGFSKDPGMSVRAFRLIASLRGSGFPVMVGPSRKRFLGELTDAPLTNRDVASAAAAAAAYFEGARLFRVHDVRLTREVLDVVSALSPQ